MAKNKIETEETNNENTAVATVDAKDATTDARRAELVSASHAEPLKQVQGDGGADNKETVVENKKKSKDNKEVVTVEKKDSSEKGVSITPLQENEIDDKKEKKEKELSPKQLAKKLEQEKLAKKKLAKEIKNKFAIENDLELKRKQITDTKNYYQRIIKNAVILFVGVGLALATFVIGALDFLNPYLAIAIAAPIIGWTVYNIVKSILTLPKLKSAYELRKMMIIEAAQKAHNDKNKKIIEAYKAEKIRIKKLKRLPYKILNYVNLLISLFSVIFFFFILDIGIAPTALVLFGLFTVTYFVVGLAMFVVAYMISENKQRTTMLQLAEEKNRLLFEEKLRSEEAVRIKLEKERRRYEEEERLRKEEAIRRQLEEAEKARLEEELKVLEAEKARIKEERAERLRIEAEEREKARQNMIKESRFLRQDYLPPAPTRAEIAKDIETLRNEFDKNLLEEVGNKFDGLDISGIEEFSNKNKIKEEYSAGITFPDVDNSDAGVNKEIDNSLLQIEQKDEEKDFLTDFDTADIEEAKTKIFENARKEKIKKNIKPNTDDEITTKELVNEVKRQVVKPTKPATVNNKTAGSSEGNGKNVSGKSFMVIKQMLKDN